MESCSGITLKIDDTLLYEMNCMLHCKDFVFNLYDLGNLVY